MNIYDVHALSTHNSVQSHKHCDTCMSLQAFADICCASLLRTHKHTYTRTHAHTHMHMHMHTHTHAHAHTHKHKHTRTHREEVEVFVKLLDGTTRLDFTQKELLQAMGASA
jgi:hypothetical protein